MLAGSTFVKGFELSSKDDCIPWPANQLRSISQQTTMLEPGSHRGENLQLCGLHRLSVSQSDQTCNLNLPRTPQVRIAR
jgi:hypothetical protein